MKEISQIRIDIASISGLQSKLRDYCRHAERFLSADVQESEMPYIVTMMTSEHWYPESQIKGYSEAWGAFKDGNSQHLSNVCFKIVQLTEELKVIKDLSSFQETLYKLKSLWNEWIQLSDTTLSSLKNDYKKLSQLHILNARSWSRTNQVVFHGIKFEYAGQILEENLIKGHTTQRYWSDGRRRQDHESDYESSLWMKGISTTRSLEFAANWAPVVLVLDLSKIKHEKEVVPFAWNYHMKQSSNFKKETEEFVVLSRTGKTYKNSEDPEFMEEFNEAMKSSDPEVVKHYQEEIHKTHRGNMEKPAGEMDLSHCLMGVFLVGYIVDIYGIDHPVIQQVINHPKFIGILEK